MTAVTAASAGVSAQGDTRGVKAVAHPMQNQSRGHIHSHRSCVDKISSTQCAISRRGDKAVSSAISVNTQGKTSKLNDSVAVPSQKMTSFTM